jgi:hypothetical protein
MEMLSHCPTCTVSTISYRFCCHRILECGHFRGWRGAGRGARGVYGGSQSVLVHQVQELILVPQRAGNFMALAEPAA